MGRKDESLLNLPVECPWWVSVLVSAFAFLFLRFIFPSIIFPGMAANAFARGLSSVAPFVALVLLLPAPIAALNSYLKKKRGDTRGAFKEASMGMASGGSCPKCGSELVVRVAKKRNNPGQRFWSCSKFPQCRFTRFFRDGK